MILGTGCLGCWRGATFNIGSSFRDVFIFYVSPYMLVIRSCDGLWDAREKNMSFIIWRVFWRRRGPKEGWKTMKLHSTHNTNWSSGSRRGEEPLAGRTLLRIWTHFGIHFRIKWIKKIKNIEPPKHPKFRHPKAWKWYQKGCRNVHKLDAQKHKQ